MTGGPHAPEKSDAAGIPRWLPSWAHEQASPRARLRLASTGWPVGPACRRPYFLVGCCAREVKWWDGPKWGWAGPSSVLTFFFFFSYFLYSQIQFESKFKFKPCGSVFTNYICAIRSTNFRDIFRYILFIFLYPFSFSFLSFFLFSNPNFNLGFYPNFQSFYIIIIIIMIIFV
jgi:hypothetical protein